MEMAGGARRVASVREEWKSDYLYTPHFELGDIPLLES